MYREKIVVLMCVALENEYLMGIGIIRHNMHKICSLCE
jgi:hypothetical protein